MPSNPVHISDDDVLYEDNHLIAINKKPSEIVQGDKTGDEPLSEKVKRYLKKKYNKPGNVFCGVIHRIDRPASGAVIFAKTGKALSRMNQFLRDESWKKMYWVVVVQRPPNDEGHLVHYLLKNQKRNMSFAYPGPGENRKKAEMKYKLVASSDRYHLLEVELLTGRHHQIRVQLAEIGCPVKGDLKYGASRSNKDASIHLHARQITFSHPVKKEKITIIADPPNEVLWDYFMQRTT
jgi:23S rRNA pseudouridine1911/1915/1917 synthase